MNAKVNKTILVVDDDADFLTQHKIYLESLGYTVITAESQHQAEEILKTVRPDLAMVDLMMEHVDGGFTLCYHIKKIDAAIPVILVTGVSSETGIEFDSSTQEERSWVKADVMLAKPVRFDQLKRELERLMKI